MKFFENVARVAGLLGLGESELPAIKAPASPLSARLTFDIRVTPGRRQFEPDSTVYEDPDTGLTFASYTSDRGIAFRVAIPDPVPEDKIFDMVLQIESPLDVGWAGWAWGGQMTYNPLAVAWANGTNNVVLSSRIA